jgi:hypothetical protein
MPHLGHDTIRNKAGEAHMQYETAKVTSRFGRLENFGRHHFAMGVKTNSAARIIRAVRFLDAVNAKARMTAMTADGQGSGTN